MIDSGHKRALAEGEIVAGRYSLLGLAGTGGMGSVYRALDARTRVQIALKLWRGPEGAHAGREAGERPDAAALTRFEREARALAAVEHPAVVRHVDHGVCAQHGPFLAMQWIDGESLSARLRRAGMTPIEGLRLVERLASGLHALHARGVVHRDLKPSNVMLPDADPQRAVIVDLGVARVAGSELTLDRGHIGTPRYMAPEQIRNARHVDGKADVFALGCILFEALTGVPAFDGDDPIAVLARILFDPLPVPSHLCPELPAPLDALCANLLARGASERPSAAAIPALVAEHESAIDPRAAERLSDPKRERLRLSQPTVLDAPPASEAPPSLARAPAFSAQAGALERGLLAALPEAAGSFVGREQECEQLAAWLSGSPLVVCWGAPGIGKTRLAIAAAQRVLRRAGASFDACVFAELGAACDADDLVRIVAREAGVALEASPAPELALARALGKLGRVLLVLDRVERVQTPLALCLRACRKSAPELSVLVTTRTRWPGAVGLELGPLPIEASDGLSPALGLFLARARETAPGLDLSAVTPGSPLAGELSALIAALEGIPLAIELCAARLRILGLRALLSRASSVTLGAGALRQAVDGTLFLLDANARRAFAECAVFAGSFAAEAAEAVLASDHGPPLALLESLRDHSLLHALFSEDGALRLALYAPLRELAAEELRASPEHAQAFERHLKYYAQAHEHASIAIGPEALARLERDADNLLCAAEYAFSEASTSSIAHALGVRALLALEPAMLARGTLTSYRALLERALELTANAAKPELRGLCRRVRQIRARLDAPGAGRERAREELELCLREARAEGDQREVASLCLELGVVYHLERALPAARRAYEEALGYFQYGEDEGSAARCTGNLGALCHDEGDFEGAARSYRKAIALYESCGELRQRANFIANLGVLEHDLGRPLDARACYERAVALLEPLRDARLLAIALGNLGALELELERPQVALAAHERCARLLAGSGDRRSEALCFARLAAALAALGRTGDAEARLARAERLALHSDPLFADAIALYWVFLELAWAEQARAAGDLDALARHLRAARARIASARSAGPDGIALCDRSDDVRAVLRIADAALARA